MAARRGVAAQRERGDAGAVGDVLGADRAGDWPAALARDRQVEQHPPVAGQQVAPPGEPYDGVAAAHQKAVAGMRRGARVVRGWSIVEELQHPLVATIAVVEKDAAIAVRRVERLQDREIGGKADEPVGVQRRLVEIGNAVLRRGCGVDCEPRASDEPLIGPDRAKRMPVCECEALANRQFDSIGHWLSSSCSSPFRTPGLRPTRGGRPAVPKHLFTPPPLRGSSAPALARAAPLCRCGTTRRRGGRCRRPPRCRTKSGCRAPR